MKIHSLIMLLSLLLGISLSAVAQKASLKQTKGFQKLPSRGLSPSDLFKKTSPSVVIVTVYDTNKSLIATGSGVVIANGNPDLTLIATNCHVVNQAAKDTLIGVSSIEGSGLAWVSGKDDARDLCLLTGPIGKTKNGVMLKGNDGKYIMVKPPAVQVASIKQLAVGDKVYAIGSPKGLGNTLSDGLVSGFRDYNGSKIIQTTAPISPGSSGGGLFDAQGQLIGITTMYLDGGQNLNFAVPADLIASVINVQRQEKPGVSPVRRAEPQTSTTPSAKANEGDRWLLVDSNLNNDSQTYIDKQSFLTKGADVSIWMKTHWSSPQLQDSEVFDEFMMNQIYRCAARQVSTIFASRWLRGTMISSMEMQATRVVIPGTVDEKIYKAICRQ